MGTFLISDIHGCNDTFRSALKSIALKKSDRLILLGDLIDRGPQSKQVLDTVFLLLETGFNIECLMGNHEKMLLDSYNDVTAKVNWIKNGGKETLKSFLTSDIKRIPDKYINFIRSFKMYIEVDNFILVHAGIDMTIEEPFSDEHSLLWLRDWKSVFNKNWLGNRKIIHGHTPMNISDMKKQFHNNTDVICIDNGSYINERDGLGAVCVLNLDNMKLHIEEPKA